MLLSISNGVTWAVLAGEIFGWILGVARLGARVLLQGPVLSPFQSARGARLPSLCAGARNGSDEGGRSRGHVRVEAVFVFMVTTRLVQFYNTSCLQQISLHPKTRYLALLTLRLAIQRVACAPSHLDTAAPSFFYTCQSDDLCNTICLSRSE